MKEHPLRRVALLIVFGLVMQVASLLYVHPISFMLFAALGVGPVVLGLMLYLWTVLRASG